MRYTILMENNCYMTLLLDKENLSCVIRCAQAMRYFNSKYPYIVMIPNKNNGYIKEQLELNDIEYREIDVLKFDESNLNKLQILTFTEFDKICFLESNKLFKCPILLVI